MKARTKSFLEAERNRSLHELSKMASELGAQESKISEYQTEIEVMNRNRLILLDRLKEGSQYVKNIEIELATLVEATKLSLDPARDYAA